MTQKGSKAFASEPFACEKEKFVGSAYNSFLTKTFQLA